MVQAFAFRIQCVRCRSGYGVFGMTAAHNATASKSRSFIVWLNWSCQRLQYSYRATSLCLQSFKLQRFLLLFLLRYVLFNFFAFCFSKILIVCDARWRLTSAVDVQNALMPYIKRLLNVRLMTHWALHCDFNLFLLFAITRVHEYVLSMVEAGEIAALRTSYPWLATAIAIPYDKCNRVHFRRIFNTNWRKSYVDGAFSTWASIFCCQMM